MKKRSLFDDEPQAEQWELDDATNVMAVEVVFPGGPEGFFDYRLSDPFIDQIEPGMRLLVPLGKSNRSVLAYVAKVHFVCNNRLKEILRIIDKRPLLSANMLVLAHWISERYLTPLGLVLDAAVPAGVRAEAGTRLTPVYTVVQKEAETNNGSAGESEIKLTHKQEGVLRFLREINEPMSLREIASSCKCSFAPILALEKHGLIKKTVIRRKNTNVTDAAPPLPAGSGHTLNPEQQEVLNAILQSVHLGEYKPFLLHGVTGSGKTEVYIQAIKEVVQFGKQAIILVPEISLTPQTVDWFRSRFQSVAVLHSNLTDSERNHEWNRIASGQVQVVVGARSAIFAPLPRCGIIIIDEEHENSFKQDTAPRYHARDVALFRGKQEKIPVILGSATPSLESWHRQSVGEFTLLSIKNRVLNLPLPMVHVVDLRNRDSRSWSRNAIHSHLTTAIKEAIDDDGQIILLLNRRGFSTQIQCPGCGEVVRCPDCDVSLTHHLERDIALCHYCDFQIPVPDRCPKCDFSGIRFSGFGTQKLQQEIANRFPGVATIRMDADTMQGHRAHEKALDAFRRGEYKILLGTQMIAKGLDFPNVTLVGVINADTALHLPDFRAAERTFHLITQVAGRTGRSSRSGKVIVQTFNPDHHSIIAAMNHDYTQFVDRELAERTAHGYPPYTSMVRIVVRGTEEADVIAFSAKLREQLQCEIVLMRESSSPEAPFDCRLLGPAPAPFAKLRGNFRYHIHIHCNDGERLRKLVEKVKKQTKSVANIQWIIDVDPVDML